MGPAGKTAALLACGLVLLCGGIWLGGHPETLPEPVRDAFVDDDRALRAEVVDSIKDSFYKPVKDSDIDENSLKGIVQGLGDQFSNYLTPKETKEFQESVEGEFEGVGMNVDEDRRGLRVINVFDGSPASDGGIKKGEFITEVNGRSIAGVSSDVATARIKGPAGTKVRLEVVDPDTATPRSLTLKRERIEVPVAESKIVERNGKKYGVVELTTFSNGAHGLLRREIDKVRARGAEGLVLDLRGNGGGLLREAVLVSSIFVEDGLITFTKGRTKPKREFQAEGKAIPKDIPVVVLVDRGSASASEIVTGALRDRKRATVVGTADLREGRLPGGDAALQRRHPRHHRGRVLPAQRREHRQEGRAAHGARGRRPRDRPRRGPAGRAQDPVPEMSVRAQGRPARLDFPMVGVLRKRGRFLVAEPLFGPRGSRVALDGRGGSEGELVLVGSGKRGARVVRRLGRPDVARDVLEALMLDRGLRRSFPRRVEEEAADPEIELDAARRDLRDLATFTIDPDDAKDFDDAISAEPRDGFIRLWVHIADVSAYVRPGGAIDSEALRRGTSVYVPGAVEPMLPEALSNRACSLRPGEDKLAVTVEMDVSGTDVRRVEFMRSLIRSDTRLTYGEVDEVFAGRARAGEPWGAPLACAREVAAALRTRRNERGALEVHSLEPAFDFDEDGHVTGVRHEQETESHTLIEELMILANEQVAGYLADRKLPALYRVHEKPDPQAVEAMVAQLASLDIPTPTAAAQHEPPAGCRRGGRGLPAGGCGDPA